MDNIYNVHYNGNIIEIRGQVMNYIAIIGDIVNSKQTSNRSSIQERLKQQLNRINHSFAQDFASPFTITKGDEFQALCKPNPYIFLISVLMSLHTHSGLNQIISSCKSFLYS